MILTIIIIVHFFKIYCYVLYKNKKFISQPYNMGIFMVSFEINKIDLQKKQKYQKLFSIK